MADARRRRRRRRRRCGARSTRATARTALSRCRSSRRWPSAGRLGRTAGATSRSCRSSWPRRRIRLFASLRLPVVSYALPALIAIGQARHTDAADAQPVTRLARSADPPPRRWRRCARSSRRPAASSRRRRSPASSTMSLARRRRRRDHARRARTASSFLVALGARGRQLADRHEPRDVGDDAVDQGARRRRRRSTRGSTTRERAQLREWLLGQQYRVEHPYTHAAPGRLGLDRSRRRRARRRRHGRRAARARAPRRPDGRARPRARPQAGVALAARPAEPRRRHADVLPRLDRAAVRSQRPRSHRARAARLVRLAAAPAGRARRRASTRRSPPPRATCARASTATARSSRCGSATRRRRAR